MHVKECITQPTIERFDQSIIGRLTWAGVVEFQPVPVCAVPRRQKRVK